MNFWLGSGIHTHTLSALCERVTGRDKFKLKMSSFCFGGNTKMIIEI